MYVHTRFPNTDDCVDVNTTVSPPGGAPAQCGASIIYTHKKSLFFFANIVDIALHLSPHPSTGSRQYQRNSKIIIELKRSH